MPARNLLSFNGHFPYLGHAASYVHNSTIIGEVSLLDGSSVWYNAVIRGMNVQYCVNRTMMNTSNGYWINTC